MDSDDHGLLTEQMAYYRAHAGEYDRPYADRPDLQELLATVDELPVTGDVLELACGTGQWTRLLAARARTVTAVDASAEMLDIARGRAASSSVTFVQGDLFGWRPERRYDTVFFGYWLSHVPPARMAAFWATVGAALAPGGRVIFVDDAPGEAVHEEVLPGRPVPTVVRRIDDGRRYRIVKVFRDAEQLSRELGALGWSARVRLVAGRSLVGVAEPGP